MQSSFVNYRLDKSDKSDKTNYNILNELKDYMLDNKNILRFIKCNIDDKNINSSFEKNKKKDRKVMNENNNNNNKLTINREKNYKPTQKDSLFWCFYILKYGISKYEMEIGNQHFVVEKQEKFKYIEMIRKSKDILKMYKIKPFTFLEDDLANSEKISIKTFFALCIIEKINIILVDKRKIYEALLTDEGKINIVHRNSINHEHYIDLDLNNEKIQLYRDTFYKMSSFDEKIKSITSYNIDELLVLCEKLNIILQPKTNANATNAINTTNTNKKLNKKDIYEQLVLHF